MGCWCSKAEDVSGFFYMGLAGCRINIFTSQGEVGEQGYTGPQGPPGSKVRGSFLQHIYRILTL